MSTSSGVVKMSMSSGVVKFVAELPDLLSSGTFSDLTLTCCGKTFEVHKVVLCTQSKVFRKLLDGNFKENGANLINLPDDEPRVLQVLIHYVYHFTLDTTSRPVTSGLWTFLVHVYALADKYDLPPLRSLVVRRLHELCNPVTNIEQFIAVLRVVDACTAENTLWDIMVPKVSDNIALLLKDQSFQELVMECPRLTLSVLGMQDDLERVRALENRHNALHN